MTNTQKQWLLYSKIILLCYSFFLCVGGILYFYAGSLIQFPLVNFLLVPAATIQQYMHEANQVDNLFILVFSFFTLSDLALCLIGTIFYILFHDHFKATFILICLMTAGICGVMVDTILLTCWQVIANASPLLPVRAQGMFWVIFGFIENLSLWLSIASSIVGAIGFYFIYLLSFETRFFTRQWTNFTLFIVILSVLGTLGMIYTLFFGATIIVALLFLLMIVFLLPSWAIWTAQGLKKAKQIKIT